MKKLLLLATGVVLVFISRPTASGALIAYEGFDYPPGSNLEGQSGGSGAWAGAWDYTGFYSTNVSGSLSYVDGLGNTLITAGNKLLNIGDSSANNSSQPGRNLSVYLSDTDGTNRTIWISFLAQRIGDKSGTGGPDGSPTYERGCNIALFDSITTNTTTGAASTPGPERVDFGENSGVTSDSWMMRFPAANGNPGPTLNSYTSNSPIDVLTFHVYRIDLNTNDFSVEPAINTNDSIFFWVNPALNSEPPTATAITNLISMKEFSFNRLRFFAGGQSGSQAYAQWLVDEVRIGDTFADVTPHIPGGGGVQPGFSAIQVTGNNVSLTVTGAPSTVYTILGSSDVTNITTVLGTATSTDANGQGGTYTDINALTGQSQRFYKAQQ